MNLCADCGKEIGQGRTRCFKCSMSGSWSFSSGLSNALVVENPANGYRERHEHIGLWTLLFGTLYFALKGVWRHAVLSFILAGFTFGLSWLIYPFFARDILKNHFQRQGWKIVRS